MCCKDDDIVVRERVEVLYSEAACRVVAVAYELGILEGQMVPLYLRQMPYRLQFVLRPMQHWLLQRHRRLRDLSFVLRKIEVKMVVQEGDCSLIAIVEDKEMRAAHVEKRLNTVVMMEDTALRDFHC